MEVALLVAMVLERFDLHLESSIREGDGSSRRCSTKTKEPEESWMALSGDVHGLLPPINRKRLVGIKVPAAECWLRSAVRKWKV